MTAKQGIHVEGIASRIYVSATNECNLGRHLSGRKGETTPAGIMIFGPETEVVIEPFGIDLHDGLP